MAISHSKQHEISISDNLWEILTKIAEHTGVEVEPLVNQAIFELAVKLGYIKPVTQESKPPLHEEELRKAGSTASFSKFSPGKTKEMALKSNPSLSLDSLPTSSAMPAARTSTVPPIPPTPGKRPPRPAPKPTASHDKTDEKDLFVINKDGDSEKIDKDIFIIGRSSKCDLVINSVKVSREHAIITRERGDFFIEDLGSANGTWYRGERIEKIKLSDGDEVYICDEKFRFIMR